MSVEECTDDIGGHDLSPMQRARVAALESARTVLGTVSIFQSTAGATSAYDLIAVARFILHGDTPDDD